MRTIASHLTVQKLKPNGVAEVEGGTVRSNLYLLTGITGKEKKKNHTAIVQRSIRKMLHSTVRSVL